MQVYVNGQAREVEGAATLAHLLESVSAPAKGIAVEVNRELIRRADHGTRPLQEGDRVEIVGLVGGG
ncbi:MAG: sulfur carrier protein ThiS [Planctomycetes bacterium]|nr:sulfur carrier protein ThiS [Planctomycetota bacterium]